MTEESANLNKIETEGHGRFEYMDGTVYEGQWKIINGKKMKHGRGTIIVGSTLTAENEQKESYTGQWVEDRMEGEGEYFYKSGAIYSGEWVHNK